MSSRSHSPRVGTWEDSPSVVGALAEVAVCSSFGRRTAPPNSSRSVSEPPSSLDSSGGTKGAVAPSIRSDCGSGASSSPPSACPPSGTAGAVSPVVSPGNEGGVTSEGGRLVRKCVTTTSSCSAICAMVYLVVKAQGWGGALCRRPCGCSNHARIRGYRSSRCGGADLVFIMRVVEFEYAGRVC